MIFLSGPLLCPSDVKGDKIVCISLLNVVSSHSYIGGATAPPDIIAIVNFMVMRIENYTILYHLIKIRHFLVLISICPKNTAFIVSSPFMKLATA